MASNKSLVGVVMGSDSDAGVMQGCMDVLREFDIPHEVRVLSAHRTPEETKAYAESAAQRGVEVIIAGAGWAAHLAGFIAGHTTLPVIGVPIDSSPFKGLDALLSAQGENAADLPNSLDGEGDDDLIHGVAMQDGDYLLKRAQEASSIELFGQSLRAFVYKAHYVQAPTSVLLSGLDELASPLPATYHQHRLAVMATTPQPTQEPVQQRLLQAQPQQVDQQEQDEQTSREKIQP